LWRGNLVHQVKIDIEHGGALGFGSHYVPIPDLVKKSLG
jgi:hypothetical protein